VVVLPWVHGKISTVTLSMVKWFTMNFLYQIWAIFYLVFLFTDVQNVQQVLDFRKILGSIKILRKYRVRPNNLDFCYFCAIFQKFSRPSPVLTCGRIFRQKRMRHTAAISSDRLFSIDIELAGKERHVKLRNQKAR
jgi:hypothetical protein